MFKPRYIQYLNLPQIPDDLLQKINKDFNSYKKQPGHYNQDTYWWSDSFNNEINDWCQKNICADMYFGFQASTGNLDLHKDHVTKTKLTYLLDCGGDNVLTEFFDDDYRTKLATYIIQKNRWHIFKADTSHRVLNVESGKIRFSITGRIFS
jgi:hypothetical protein